MLLNLTDVFTTEGKVAEQTIPLEVKEIFYQGEKFTISEKNPVCLTLKNDGQGRATIEGKIQLVIVMQCDRCLQDLKQKFDFSFIRRVCSPELAEENTEDEFDFMEGFNLNVEDLICNEILINWPMKVLCKEDCKGICKICGKDLNQGACECDTFVPDPRMAVIKDIFNANKEV